MREGELCASRGSGLAEKGRLGCGFQSAGRRITAFGPHGFSGSTGSRVRAAPPCALTPACLEAGALTRAAAMKTKPNPVKREHEKITAPPPPPAKHAKADACILATKGKKSGTVRPAGTRHRLFNACAPLAYAEKASPLARPFPDFKFSHDAR